MSLRVLLSEAQIQARIKELGAQIDADYPEGNLHLVCILKGACFFLSDLARAIKRDTFIEFMGISSYGRGKTTSGEVKVTKDLDINSGVGNSTADVGLEAAANIYLTETEANLRLVLAHADRRLRRWPDGREMQGVRRLDQGLDGDQGLIWSQMAQ